MGYLIDVQFDSKLKLVEIGSMIHEVGFRYDKPIKRLNHSHGHMNLSCEFYLKKFFSTSFWKRTFLPFAHKINHRVVKKFALLIGPSSPYHKEFQEKNFEGNFQYKTFFSNIIVWWVWMQMFRGHFEINFGILKTSSEKNLWKKSSWNYPKKNDNIDTNSIKKSKLCGFLS